jgi:hypothetical protein
MAWAGSSSNNPMDSSSNSSLRSRLRMDMVAISSHLRQLRIRHRVVTGISSSHRLQQLQCRHLVAPEVPIWEGRMW